MIAGCRGRVPGVNSTETPSLPPTSWAVLGLLSFGEELTGSDLKKWADWSIGFFYWSPSVSQVYAELKKLEQAALVTSRKTSDQGVRDRRLYSITDAGVSALREWSRAAAADVPVLKHGVMLRLWMGHLLNPDELKDMVGDHAAALRDAARRAAEHAEHSESEPGWAFSQISLRWAERYYAAQVELTEQLLDDIDRAFVKFRRGAHADELGLPRPERPGRWRVPGDED